MFADALRAAMDVLCQTGEIKLLTDPARTASGGFTSQIETRAIRGHWTVYDKAVLATGIPQHKRVAMVIRDDGFEITPGATLTLPDEAGRKFEMEVLAVAMTPYAEAWILAGN